MSSSKAEQGVRGARHPLLAATSLEDQSRQTAIVLMRHVLSKSVRNRNRKKFFDEGASVFRKAHGRAPETIDELAASLFESHGYRTWSAINRAIQEMLWVSVGEPIVKDLERIEQTAAQIAASPPAGGSLRLDPEYLLQPDIESVDVHLQPGGYFLDRSPADVLAGALYEAGGNVFSFSVGGNKADSKAAAVAKLIGENYPDFRPQRILDVGCSAGSASTTHALLFPEAEVHAIDIAPSMLRYAHARSEALGAKVHYQQMNARKMDFPDEHFDFVVSHNALHEMSTETRLEVMKESVRVLRKGGVLVFQDIEARAITDPLDLADFGWEEYFNGEPFWRDFTSGSFAEDLVRAGLKPGAIKEFSIPAVAGRLRWFIISGTK